MHSVDMLRFIKKNIGFRTAVLLIWLAIALSVETKPAAQLLVRHSFLQPRWQFPCQTPDVDQTRAPFRPDEILITLDVYYRQIYENAITLQLQVENLMERYVKEYIQDNFVLEMLKNEKNVPCLPTAQDKLTISMEAYEGQVVDKGLIETLTAFNKLAKYVSYFVIATEMNIEDEGGIIDQDNLKQSDITEGTYSLLCDLHSVLERREVRTKLREFLANDVIQAEECLAGAGLENNRWYYRDYAYLNSFFKILKHTVRQFEELYRKAKD